MARFPQLAIQETETEHPTYALTSNDFDLYSPIFELCDKDGGGYDWQTVAEYLIRSKSRKLFKTVTFDSEASLFCALSDRKPALEELAKLLRHTFRSRQRLLRAVRESESLSEKRPTKRNDFVMVVVVHFNEYLYHDKERLIDSLFANLGKRHRLVYYPSGSGETTLYVRTSHPDDAIRLLKPVLMDFKLLRSATLAVAPRGSTEYSVVYPRKRKSPLIPTNELCPSIP